jgi:hypothetical protein
MLTRLRPSPWGKACVRETIFVPIGGLVEGRVLSGMGRHLASDVRRFAVLPSAAHPDHARSASPDLVRSGRSDCTRGHERACSRQEVPLRLLSWWRLSRLFSHTATRSPGRLR